MTIEQFIEFNYSNHYWDQNSAKQLAIDFAKHHTSQALIEAVGEAPLHCKEGILNCYKDKIK